VAYQSSEKTVKYYMQQKFPAITGSQFAKVFVQLNNHLNIMNAVSYIINDSDVIVLAHLEISYGYLNLYISSSNKAFISIIAKTIIIYSVYYSNNSNPEICIRKATTQIVMCMKHACAHM